MHNHAEETRGTDMNIGQLNGIVSNKYAWPMNSILHGIRAVHHLARWS